MQPIDFFCSVTTSAYIHALHKNLNLPMPKNDTVIACIPNEAGAENMSKLHGKRVPTSLLRTHHCYTSRCMSFVVHLR